MTYKVLSFTAAALVALNSAAFAQTTVGSQTVDAGDLPSVRAHCEMLAGGGTESTMEEAGISGNPDADDVAEAQAAGSAAPADEATSPIESGNDDAADAQQQVAEASEAAPTTTAPAGTSGNPDAEENVASINLQQITLADCQAAGL